MKKNVKIVLDPFCMRQFDKTKTNFFINYDPDGFESIVNSHYIENKDKCLKDGYAPFCKHIFIENFTDMAPNYLEITAEVEKLIKTAYEARTEKELPVLKRFVPYQSVKEKLRPAKFLDVILYSKAQIAAENEAMGNEEPNKDADYDYGIISVKSQDVDYELSMDPITMMRNALGKDEGGSGVPLERKKYLESVGFWSDHVLIK